MRLFLTVLFTLVFSFSAQKATADDFTLDFPATEVFNLSESEFYQALQQQSVEQTKRIAPFLDQEQKEGLKLATELAIEKFKALNPWPAMKNLFQTYRIVGIGFAVTEISSWFIFPAVFTAIGIPVKLAVLAAGLPTTSVLLPSYLVWLNKRKQKELSKALGIKDLASLENFRKKLLGLSADRHILTTTLKNLREEKPIRIIRRKFSDWRSSIQISTIHIQELEAIVTRHSAQGTKRILSRLADEDDQLYSLLLLRSIEANGDASYEYQMLIEKRRSLVRGAHSLEELDHLRELNHGIDLLEKSQQEVDLAIKNLNRADYENSQQYLTLKDLLESLQQERRILELEMRKYELGFLAFLKDGKKMDDFPPYPKYRRLMNRYRTTSRTIIAARTFNRSSRNVQASNKLYNKIRVTYADWTPGNWLKNKGSHCFSLLSEIL